MQPLIFPTAFGAGVLAHLLFFIRGEWHLRGPNVFLFHLSALASAPMLWANLTEMHLLRCYLLSAAIFSVYLAGLFASIAIYRLFFHRIRNFPGPKGAALSKIWHAWQCRNSTNHLLLDDLYHMYGTFVRTGPAEITIFHAEGQEIMDGPTQNNTRSDWYEIVHPRVSPIFSRTNEDHRERRDIWNYALSSKTIRDYLPDICRQIQKLKETIAASASRPIPIPQIMQMFAFDSMGHFSYGESFDQVETRKWHDAALQQRSALGLLGPFTPLPWAIVMAFRFIPQTWKVKDWNAMADFCEQSMQNRITSKTKTPTIASWIVGQYEEGLNKKNETYKMNLLCGNALALTIGASDTSQSSLTALFYHIALFPNETAKLRQELEKVDRDNADQLAVLPHLNGFINESMRLLPAAMTFGTRLTPPEGLWVENTWIPGGIKITSSRWTVSRMPSVYPEPLSFIPERWYSRPELIKDKRAFAPFGTGKRGCVGKGLALAQLRLLMASIIPAFDINFAPGTDVPSIEGDLLDQMTGQLGEFSLTFQPRDISVEKGGVVA